MHASCNGHLKIVRLLAQAGAQMDSQDGEGSTALLLAGSAGHIEVVAFLLEAGANKNFQHPHQRTLLMHACSKGQTSLVRLLLEAGADKESISPLGIIFCFWLYKTQEDTKILFLFRF